MKILVTNVDALLKSFARWHAGTRFWKHKIFLALFYILILILIVFAAYIVIPFQGTDYLSTNGLAWGILVVSAAAIMLARYRLFSYTQEKLGTTTLTVSEEKIDSLKKVIRTNNILILCIVLLVALSAVIVHSLWPQLNLFITCFVPTILLFEYSNIRLYRKLLEDI